ncbi:hypothetical protein A2442_02275 [Candidatus Campbellbacteria bacterium RIFOXYC2_FULL_35_25]|uniref:Uncharacterized protein n=1 Tax=Candidatus Campbellbacteria bacterium RIFOXYC2_FULL_35_25 TaxID=1797582 RepID=A0A1F5EHF8_9BACT|nr:MAG: hypothetical protein A2442_02275 [Candidatus Campbellbacteria bacterium RIFOXYC2_FULL_35_25]
MYLSFDIPSGTTVEEFFQDISCNNRIPSPIIVELLKQSLSGIDYFIRARGPREINLQSLDHWDIQMLLNGFATEVNGEIVSPEDGIYSDKDRC